MKKMVMGFAFICCLVLGVQTSLTKARAATNWKEYKTLTVKKVPLHLRHIHRARKRKLGFIR